MSATRDFVAEFHHAVDELDGRYRRDNETMLLLGRLAARFVGKAHADNWTGLKLRLTPQSREELVASLEVQASRFAADHQPKAAFVARLLGLSVVAGVIPDAKLISRDHQLNIFVDAAAAVVRDTSPAAAHRLH